MPLTLLPNRGRLARVAGMESETVRYAVFALTALVVECAAQEQKSRVTRPADTTPDDEAAAASNARVKDPQTLKYLEWVCTPSPGERVGKLDG